MNKNICPCCERHEFKVDNNFEICPVCKWVDDGVQRDKPDLDGCGNTLSLNQFRKQWEDKQFLQEITQAEKVCNNQTPIEIISVLKKMKERLAITN